MHYEKVFIDTRSNAALYDINCLCGKEIYF